MPRGVNPPPKKKKRRTYLPAFFWGFWRFSGLILENVLMVFLGSSCRETAKNAIKKIRWEKTTEKGFREKNPKN
jgi:hypothetical protein